MCLGVPSLRERRVRRYLKRCSAQPDEREERERDARDDHVMRRRDEREPNCQAKLSEHHWHDDERDTAHMLSLITLIISAPDELKEWIVDKLDHPNKASHKERAGCMDKDKILIFQHDGGSPPVR